MAVKTITVTEEAYGAVKQLKTRDESFSDLFLRIGKKHPTFADIRGLLLHTPDKGATFAHRVEEAHARLGADVRRRVDDVRTRLQRTH